LDSTLNSRHELATVTNPSDSADNGTIPLAAYEGTAGINKQSGQSRTSTTSLQDSSVNNASDSSGCAQSRTKHSDNTSDEKTDTILPPSGTMSSMGEKRVGKSENFVCPRGKEVKTGGFRAARYGHIEMYSPKYEIPVMLQIFLFAPSCCAQHCLYK